MARARQLLGVFVVFLRAGATTFGGMWAATTKMERDLVERAGCSGSCAGSSRPRGTSSPA